MKRATLFSVITVLLSVGGCGFDGQETPLTDDAVALTSDLVVQSEFFSTLADQGTLDENEAPHITVATDLTKRTLFFDRLTFELMAGALTVIDGKDGDFCARQGEVDYALKCVDATEARTLAIDPPVGCAALFTIENVSQTVEGEVVLLDTFRSCSLSVTAVDSDGQANTTTISFDLPENLTEMQNYLGVPII